MPATQLERGWGRPFWWAAVNKALEVLSLPGWGCHSREARGNEHCARSEISRRCFCLRALQTNTQNPIVLRGLLLYFRFMSCITNPIVCTSKQQQQAFAAEQSSVEVVLYNASVCIISISLYVNVYVCEREMLHSRETLIFAICLSVAASLPFGGSEKAAGTRHWPDNTSSQQLVSWSTWAHCFHPLRRARVPSLDFPPFYFCICAVCAHSNFPRREFRNLYMYFRANMHLYLVYEMNERCRWG